MRLTYTIALCFFLFACGEPQKAENNTVDSVAAVSPVKKDTSPPVVSSEPIKEANADAIQNGPAAASNEKTVVEVKTFENTADDNAKGTWGYDIYMNQTKYIHQPNIPPMPGIKGFSTEAKARKAGEFVAYKVKHNISPPSVSPKELDSLGILH